jgi:4-amino-4-deoxy-L-arabinose transferase-like glycosyltransferase
MRNPVALRVLLGTLAALFSIFTYFYGLNSQHIPKNGDESVYINITRLTAASGHWLPLRAEDPAMRNTKPPLLFWQGIESTDRGKYWTLWNLRCVAVVYTLLTAGLVFLLCVRFSGDWSRGVTAALVYLAFYSTYRYGRPFLTDSPQTFWLFLAYFVPLYWPQAALTTRWAPILIGLLTGIGLLYKSFALVLPVSLAVGWWYWHHRGYQWRVFLKRDAWKPVAVAIIALAVFSLWFVIDPEPQAVWQDFVLGQNTAKFTGAESYWRTLLWGGSSLWTMILGAPINAGLLALPVAALMVSGVRTRLTEGEKLLWIWLLAILVAFCLPSQRSVRYLLTAMPAVAALCGLGFARVWRGWFIMALAVGAAAIALVAYESELLGRAMRADLFSAGYWLLLSGTCLLCIASIFVPALTRPATPMAALLMFCTMAAFLKPFDGPRGNFDGAAQVRVTGRDVWVPSDFSTGEEAYRFLLPTAIIHRYSEARENIMAELARRYPYFAVRVPLDSAACAHCRVLSRRLDLRGRLGNGDILELLHGRIFQTVFLQELLIESTAQAPEPATFETSP